MLYRIVFRKKSWFDYFSDVIDVYPDDSAPIAIENAEDLVKKVQKNLKRLREGEDDEEHTDDKRKRGELLVTSMLKESFYLPLNCRTNGL